MDKFEDILDYQEENEYVDPDRHLASSGQRLANYFLDRIGAYVFIFLLSSVIGENGLFDDTEELSFIGSIFILIAIFGYWAFFEYYVGKTPAKFITKTKVVTKYGKKPTFLNIVGRTLCRLIPFDAFSYLGTKPIGWHDSISGTRVVTDDYIIADDFV